VTLESPRSARTAHSTAGTHRQTRLVALSALLWAATTALAWSGHWYAGLFSLLVLMATYALLGIAHKGRISRRLLSVPLLSWLVIWGGAFGIAQHYAVRFAGGPPEFTIMGLHPSFAWIVIAYWLVGTLVMTLGFYWHRDAWLSEARWQQFLDDVRDAEHRKAG